MYVQYGDGSLQTIEALETRSRWKAENAGNRGKRSLVSNKTDLWRIVRNVNLARSWRREFQLSALQCSYPSSKIVAGRKQKKGIADRMLWITRPVFALLKF